MTKQQQKKIESASTRFTNWIGSPSSLVAHSVFFVAIFALEIVGVAFDKILLILTTAVSLEAIYLSIFIQMTVNKNTQSLEEVEEDIDEIQKDVDEIQEDVDEVQKDIDEIQEDEVEDDKHDSLTIGSLNKIEAELQKLVRDIEALKHQKK